jgi:hypothetical protein
MWERGGSGCVRSSGGGGAEGGSEVGWCCSANRRIVHIAFEFSKEVARVETLDRDSR